jgi:hypothetical protein
MLNIFYLYYVIILEIGVYLITYDLVAVLSLALILFILGA